MYHTLPGFEYFVFLKISLNMQERVLCHCVIRFVCENCWVYTTTTTTTTTTTSNNNNNNNNKYYYYYYRILLHEVKNIKMNVQS
jgi:hypothetical protein